MVEIPSGTQDGRAVEDLLRLMHLRPMAGSGWKVVIINEADRMTPQAEVMWLDGLRSEKLPAKTVVVFTGPNAEQILANIKYQLERKPVHRRSSQPSC